MEIRKGREEDLPRIGWLYSQARRAMGEAGIDQWQNGDYPNEADARKDMDQGRCYVLEEGGEVLAVACLAFGHEPTYDEIEGEGWERDDLFYGFLHRIAVAPEAKGRGAAGLLFDELKRQARDRGVEVIRGDTHRDNKPMQRVMDKAGLACRGVIHVEDGTPRLAYEAVLGPGAKEGK